MSVRLMAMAAAVPVLTYGISLAGMVDDRLAQPALAALAGGGTVALVLAVLLAAAMARSVSRAQDAERRLLALQEERRLSDIGGNFPGIIYRRVMTADGRISYPYASTGLGVVLAACEPQSLSQLAQRLFHPDDRGRWCAAVAESAHTLAPFHCEVRLADGDRWVRSAASPRRESDGSVVWDGVLLDVSDLKQAEAALKRSLAEKEVMLREIHHRVRNNLQVVSSLLHIEALQIADADARSRLAEVGRRIGALGHLHEQLYGATDFASVDCGAHLRRLCQDLMDTRGPAGPVLVADIQPLRCDLDTAIPLGLITHELLHEAGAGGGRIVVSLARDDDAAVLTVTGETTAEAPPRQVGHRIALALADQLDARLSQDGACISLRMPADRFRA